MQHIRDITLDVSSRSYLQCAFAKQWDNETRFIRATITAGGQQIVPEVGAMAMIRVLKADHHYADKNAVILEDGRVLVELTDQMLACPGMAEADIVIMKDGEVLSTAVFYIEVEKAPFGTDIKSEDEFGVMVEATQAALEAAEKALSNSVTSVNGETGAVKITTVATAEKLANPREISITGDVSGSVSFDGSGDADINAALSDSIGGRYRKFLTSADDLDDILDPGFYLFWGTDAPKNAPWPTSLTIVEVIKCSSYVLQRAVKTNTAGQCAFRLKGGYPVSWGAWTEIYTGNNKPTAADVGALALANIETGMASIPTTANSVSSANVKFSKAFSNTPRVVATSYGSNLSTFSGLSITDISTTGFTINILRTNAVTTNVYWIAARAE